MVDRYEKDDRAALHEPTIRVRIGRRLIARKADAASRERLERVLAAV